MTQKNDKSSSDKIVGAAQGIAAKMPGVKPHAARKPNDVGLPPLMNRTGVDASPIDGKEMARASELVPPTPGDPQGLLVVRREYEADAGPIGTMPPPTSARSVVDVAKGALQGKKATVLIDKLGERLAFERTGVRLYEGLLHKLDVRGSFAGGPTREELARHLDEELAHFHLLVDAMKRIGADPTAMTPSADVAAVLSSGVPKIIADPRTTLVQCLEAILVAELVDNDCWATLVHLCDEMGEDALADQMRQALIEENQHLDSVRGWLEAATEAAVHREDVEAPIEQRPIV